MAGVGTRGLSWPRDDDALDLLALDRRRHGFVLVAVVLDLVVLLVHFPARVRAVLVLVGRIMITRTVAYVHAAIVCALVLLLVLLLSLVINLIDFGSLQLTHYICISFLFLFFQCRCVCVGVFVFCVVC